MSFWDLVPTVGEVFSKVACTLTDHDWRYAFDKELKKDYRWCTSCRKVELV